MDVIEAVVVHGVDRPECLDLTQATCTELREWFRVSAGGRNTWVVATLDQHDLHFSNLYAGEQPALVDVIHDEGDRFAYERMQEYMRRVGFERSLKALQDDVRLFNDPVFPYRDTRRSGEKAVCPTLGFTRRNCPCCKNKDPERWGKGLCDTHYDYLNACIICNIHDNKRDLVYNYFVYRSLHKRMDVDGCAEYTGLTSQQLRVWFDVQADGHQWQHIDHVWPKSLWNYGDCDQTTLEGIKASKVHWFWNLQPLTKRKNLSKHNDFTDEDKLAWRVRVAELSQCGTFEEAVNLIRLRGIHFGDTLHSWRCSNAPRPDFAKHGIRARETARGTVLTW